MTNLRYGVGSVRQRQLLPLYVRADSLPKIVSQGRFWLGIVLVAVGASMVRATIPVGIAAVAGVGVAAGLLFIIKAMRLNNNR